MEDSLKTSNVIFGWPWIPIIALATTYLVDASTCPKLAINVLVWIIGNLTFEAHYEVFTY